jgi:hypothetical protein
MTKMLIIAAVVLAALFTAPATRVHMLLLAHPVLEKLGPFGERLATPAKVYATKNDVSNLIRLLAIERNDRRRLPNERDFAAWAKRHAGDDAIDHWGHPYWIRKLGADSLIVGSNGPDGKRRTADDIQQTMAD